MQLGRKWLISESSLAEYLKGEERSQTQDRKMMTEQDRFRHFSDSAKAVLAGAMDEAVKRNHNYIGTEHLLVALVASPATVLAATLKNADIDASAVRRAVDEIVLPGTDPVTGPIGLTPRAKRAIELAVEEAADMSAAEVECAHLLLGLVTEREGISANVLRRLGATLESLRENVISAAGEHATTGRPEDPRAGTKSRPS